MNIKERLLNNWPKELIQLAYHIVIDCRRYPCTMGYLLDERTPYAGGVPQLLTKENDKIISGETRIQRSKRMKKFFKENIEEDRAGRLFLRGEND